MQRFLIEHFPALFEVLVEVVPVLESQVQKGGEDVIDVDPHYLSFILLHSHDVLEVHPAALQVLVLQLQQVLLVEILPQNQLNRLLTEVVLQKPLVNERSVFRTQNGLLHLLDLGVECLDLGLQFLVFTLQVCVDFLEQAMGFGEVFVVERDSLQDLEFGFQIALDLGVELIELNVLANFIEEGLYLLLVLLDDFVQPLHLFFLLEQPLLHLGVDVRGVEVLVVFWVFFSF